MIELLLFSFLMIKYRRVLGCNTRMRGLNMQRQVVWMQLLEQFTVECGEQRIGHLELG